MPSWMTMPDWQRVGFLNQIIGEVSSALRDMHELQCLLWHVCMGKTSVLLSPTH